MIALASDHGGYEIKCAVIEHLKKNGCEYKDLGTDSCRESVDYPDYALLAAECIRSGECEKAIIICGTGIGISISANKVPGIRAALCTDSYMAKMSRQHNNANMLALGGRVVGEGLALEIVDAWLETEFVGESQPRHKRRVEKITDIEIKMSEARSTRKARREHRSLYMINEERRDDA
jgi:ribose 5-phosphate isomerase B